MNQNLVFNENVKSSDLNNISLLKLRFFQNYYFNVSDSQETY